MARSPSATCVRSGAWRLPMTVVRLCPCCFSVKEKLWLSCSLASTWRSPKRLRKAPAPTKSTPSASNTSPRNKYPLPDSSGHFRTQMCCQCGLRRTLTLLDRLTPTIAELTQAIEREVENSPEAQRLQTHPGVGPLTALAFVLILGKADRFQCGKQIASYLGL